MDAPASTSPTRAGRLNVIAEAMWTRLRGLGFTRPPIDSYRVAAHSGVEVIEWPLPPRLAGLLVPAPGQPRIYVNLRHSWQRRQFTVMHELVHAWFHAPAAGSPLQAPGPPSMDLEREADSGAAAGKMPAALVRQQVGLVGADPALLAHVFGVSRAAMVKRLAELGLGPAAAPRGAAAGDAPGGGRG